MRVVKLEMHGTSVSEGWNTSTRRERLPSNWSELRGIVMQNALYRCQATMKDGSRCTDKGTDVDHIEPGDNHDLSNLQLLCKWHHNKKSSQEGNKARPRYTEKRPPEAHPGVL
jgi:5-methylcytosine-specific restriction endonuclease McrA